MGGANGYYFGESFVAYPVVVQADKKTGLAETPIYIPEGLWFDRINGKIEQGPKLLKRQFMLTEYGLYQDVKSIVPFLISNKTLGEAAQLSASHINWQVVVPSKETASGMVQEGYLIEDMNDRNPEENYANLTISLQWKTPASVDFQIKEEIQGVFPSPPRTHWLQLHNWIGKVVDEKNEAVESVFCRHSLTTYLKLEGRVTGKLSLVVHEDALSIEGLKGAHAKVRQAKKLLDAANVNYGVKDRGALNSAANILVMLQYKLDAGTSIFPLVAQFWEDLALAQTQVEALKPHVNSVRFTKVQALITEALNFRTTPDSHPVYGESGEILHK